MNPNIAFLAQQPRGKAYRSRLIPYDADIWRWLEAGETYRQIALNLRESGLNVSLSAVHDYVAVRIRRRNRPSRLPGPSPVSKDEPKDVLESPVRLQRRATSEAVNTGANVTAHKEFIFIPIQEKYALLNSEDLALNDPTTYNNEKHSSSN